MHSALLATVLLGCNSVTVEKDQRQRCFAQTHLPLLFDSHAPASSLSSSSSSSSFLQLSTPTSLPSSGDTVPPAPLNLPKPHDLPLSQDLLAADINHCPVCLRSTLDTSSEVVGCAAPGCKYSVHQECMCLGEDGQTYCSKKCIHNVVVQSQQ